jgi:RyR domain
VSDEYKSIEVSHIQLRPELLELTELLARHLHDTWVRLRVSEGWTLGPTRNDERKEHPCLIPYEQLPEAEKELDRQMTRATLSTLVALGFEIARPGGDK